MKFENALEAIIEKKSQLNPIFKNQAIFGEMEELKIAAAVWNMIALALAEKGLDDFIVIDNNNNMISIPLKGKGSEENDKTKTTEKSKGPKDKGKNAEKGLVNEQNEEKPETEPAPE